MNQSKIKSFKTIISLLFGAYIINAIFSINHATIRFKNHNCVSIYLDSNDEVKYKRTFKSDRKGDFKAIHFRPDNFEYYFNLERYYNESWYRGDKYCEYENSNDLFQAIGRSIHIKEPGSQDCNATSIEKSDFYFGYNRNKNTYVDIKFFKEKNCQMSISINYPYKTLKYKVYTHLNESKLWQKMYFSVLEFNTNVKTTNLCWPF